MVGKRFVFAFVASLSMIGIGRAALPPPPPLPPATILMRQHLPLPPPPPPPAAEVAGIMAKVNTANPARIADEHETMPLVQPADGHANNAYRQVWRAGLGNPETKQQADQQIDSGEAAYLVVNRGNTKSISLRLKDGSSYSTGFNNLILMNAYGRGVPIVALSDSWFGGLNIQMMSAVAQLVLQVMMVLFLIGVGIWFVRKIMRGKMRRVDGDHRVKTTFDDIAGLEEVKAEMREIVEFMRDPGRFKQMGATVPRGVLLKGPPGTGKTLLARAVAGEAGVPFFSLNASDIIDTPFVGVAAGRVRNLFRAVRRAIRQQSRSNKAKKLVPAPIRRLFGKLFPRAARRASLPKWMPREAAMGGIVFIDEIDMVGRRRDGGAATDLKSEREHILTQFLVELDGIDARGGLAPIVLICATNRADVLDPALLRAGRLDRHIDVPRPDRNEKTRILELHAKKKPVSPDIKFRDIAMAMPGATGADLERLTNEAAIEAIRQNKTMIDQKCYEAAIFRVLLGTPRPNLAISERERQVIAYHEAGHAVAAFLLQEADPPVVATIVSHGAALGLVMMEVPDNEHMRTRAKMLAEARVLLAGRAAEIMKFSLDASTTGAESDRSQVLEMLHDLVGRFGLSDKARYVGAARYNGIDGGSRMISDEALGEFNKAVAEEFGRAEADIEALLKENKGAVERVAQALLRQRYLGRADIAALIMNTDVETAIDADAEATATVMAGGGDLVAAHRTSET